MLLKQHHFDSLYMYWVLMKFLVFIKLYKGGYFIFHCNVGTIGARRDAAIGGTVVAGGEDDATIDTVTTIGAAVVAIVALTTAPHLL